MPEIGEEARAIDIGKNGGTRKFVWVFCKRCKIERWVHKRGSGLVSNTSRLCRDCSVYLAKHGFHLW